MIETKCSVAKFGATLEIDPVEFDMQAERWGFDAEWHPETKKLIGFALSPSADQVYFFTKLTLKVRELLGNKILYIHNAVGDLEIMKQAGVTTPLANVRDTMHRSYTLNTERKKHGLKDLCAERFNAQWASYEDMVKVPKTVINAKGKEKTIYEFISLDQLPTQEVAEYCGCDALFVRRLGEDQEAKIYPSNHKVLQDIDLPLALVIKEGQDVGILTDTKRLQELKVELTGKADELATRLKTEVGNINLESPKQLLPQLQRVMGRRLTATNEKILQSYLQYPIVDLLLQYREYKKLIGTYVDGLLEYPTAPVIHANFNQCLTATARLSSSNPNLQNIPARTDLGKLLREVFIARPGMTFVNADYSQADLRMIANWSREKSWVKTFQAGGDIHSLTASEVGVKRQVAKTLNLIIANSGGAFRIAEELKISVDQAKPIAKKLRQKFKGIYEWMEWLCKGAASKGGVTTIGGRFIPAPMPSDMEYHQWCRNTVSKKVQGSTSDLARMGMVALYNAGIRPILVQEHDAILTEQVDVTNTVTKMTQILESVPEIFGFTCLVPLKVEVKTGKNWREAK